MVDKERFSAVGKVNVLQQPFSWRNWSYEIPRMKCNGFTVYQFAGCCVCCTGQHALELPKLGPTAQSWVNRFAEPIKHAGLRGHIQISAIKCRTYVDAATVLMDSAIRALLRLRPAQVNSSGRGSKDRSRFLTSFMWCSEPALHDVISSVYEGRFFRRRLLCLPKWEQP
jgi:hypothetical protein